MRRAPDRGGRAAFVGVQPLLKVSLHQDLRSIAPWIGLIAALSASSVLVYDWVFPDVQARAGFAATVAANPALALIFGPARDLASADGFNAWRAGALGGFFAALMAIFIVTRNSRANEDSGQAELVASGVVGREARLAVAVAMAGFASVLLGVAVTVVTILFGGGAWNSVTLAATFTASGLMFGAVAAIAAQVGSDARTANALSVTVLGIAFVFRGYVDAAAAPEWLIWLTPLGWTQEVRVAAENRWWPLLLALGFATIVVVVAFILQARRDFGMGLLAPRRGPARGPSLTAPWRLALRLHRSSVISWTLTFAGVGSVFGFLVASVGDVFAESPLVQAMMAAGAVTEEALTFEFVVTILHVAAIVAATYGVQVVMRSYAEESEGRAEPLLATAVSRPAYLASNALVAFLGPAVGLLLVGTVIGTVAAAVDGRTDAGQVVRQALVSVPAVWVLVALALLAVGAHPSKRLVGWLGVVATFALTILGPLFNLWDWILGISPLWHVPNVAVAQPDWSGLGWLALVAAIFTSVAFVGYRRRDVL